MTWGRRKQTEAAQDILFDASKVDLVSLAADESAVELHIVADGAWTGSDEQIRSLQEKVQTYVGYAVDGQLVAAYPECASMPWRIVIQCRSGGPDPRTADVLARTRQPVQGYGGDLVVNG